MPKNQQKSSLIGLMLMLGLFTSISHATEISSKSEVQSVFFKGERIESDNFIGMVWLNRLVTADEENPIYIGNVTFAAGARTNWHSHPTGQILLALAGTGYYQEKGSAKQILQKGDVIKCPPNAMHWHGATEDSEFTHTAISSRGEKPVKWFSAVTEEEYNN